MLKPAVVVNQVLGVATGLTSLDMPAILANLDLLPQKVAALDAHGAHKIAGDLNNQFSPLVKMAAGVDLKWVSQVLSVIPDPSGYTQVAALVASILGDVDIIKPRKPCWAGSGNRLVRSGEAVTAARTAPGPTRCRSCHDRPRPGRTRTRLGRGQHVSPAKLRRLIRHCSVNSPRRPPLRVRIWNFQHWLIR